MSRDASPLTKRRRSDIALLIAALSSAVTVVGFYDVRANLSAPSGVVDVWGDVRGFAGGPALTAAGSARPVVGASGITFDGVAQFLRATGGGLAGITSDCALVAVMRGQAANAGRAFELSVDGTTSILVAQQAAGPVWSAGALANTTMLQNAAAPQILHARKKVNTGYGSQAGAAAETTAASVGSNATAGRLTVGANRSDAAASFASITGLRALLVLAGDYSGAQSIVNAWAVAQHGAVA